MKIIKMCGFNKATGKDIKLIDIYAINNKKYKEFICLFFEAYSSYVERIIVRENDKGDYENSAETINKQYKTPEEAFWGYMKLEYGKEN